MRHFLLKWIISTISIAIVVELLPGIQFDSFTSLLLTSLFLGIIGPFLRAIMILFTLPLFLLSFGLIYFVINGIILYIASGLIPGFSVDSFWAALLASLLISLAVTLINWLIKDDRKRVVVYRD